jgi:hypothetical protein
MTFSPLLLSILLLVLDVKAAHASRPTNLLLRGFPKHGIKQNNHTSFCSRIHPEDLSSDCTCHDGNTSSSSEGPLSFVVECERVFDSSIFNDTLAIKLIVAPCDARGSSISLDIVELKHNLIYKVEDIRAGDEVNLPIPGVSVVVPGIGHVGIDAAVLISGNPDELTLKVGVNACVAIRDKQVCASDIPGLDRILPWWILSGTFTFGDICGNNSTGVIQVRRRDPETATSILAISQS